jgi:hypothetical protein
MLFGQLANRESLWDLIVALDAYSGKSYHLGLGKSITWSNFAKANEESNRTFVFLTNNMGRSCRHGRPTAQKKMAD